MKRRDLLKAVAAGSVVMTGCGSGADGAVSPADALPVSGPGTAPSPAPTPAPVAAAPSPAPAPADGDLVALVLSTSVGGPQPFTVGQVFRKGDIPAGTTITSSTHQFQAEVRNRWSDGSVRLAVLSGVAPAGVINIRKGGPPFVAPNVGEPPIEATVEFTNVRDSAGNAVAGGSHSATVSTARAAGAGAWSRTSARKVREMLGPVMSEFHYFVPTSDAHTHVWFFVRAYVTGQTEVETVVENGWLLVSSPGQRTYNVSVSVGGTQRYTGAGIAHYHHTRWSRVDWIGGDPQVTPKHDVAYLQATALVPALSVTSLNATAYQSTPDAGTKYASWTKSLADQPAPFAIANIDPSLGSGGHSDNVGLLPAWDMAYLVEGHPGAYHAIQGNTRAGGRFSVHYRDETTGRPARGSQYPALGFNDTLVSISDNAGNNAQLTPAPSGGSAPNWTYSHGPSLGYLAYLTSGRWSAWEELQFISSAADFFQSGNLFAGYRIAPWWIQLRSHAWIYRARAQAAISAPQFLNGAALTTGADHEQWIESMGRLNADIDYYHGTHVSGGTVAGTPAAARNNVFGLFYLNADYDGLNDGRHTYGGMFQGYNALSIMWSFVAEASSNSRLGELAAFAARFPVGMLGAAPGSTLWDWRVCAFYQLAFGNGGWNGSDVVPTTFRQSWNEQWTFLTTQLTWTPSNPFPLPSDNRLRQFSPVSPSDALAMGSPMAAITNSSHVVALVACVAFAHEVAAKVAVSGADTMAQRLYGSDTWRDSLTTSFKDYPGWAIRSRRY